MAVINTLKILQAKVHHWQTYKNMRSEDPDMTLLNKHGVRNNGKIKTYCYKTKWKNLSYQARDGEALVIKRRIKPRIISNLSN